MSDFQKAILWLSIGSLLAVIVIVIVLSTKKADTSALGGVAIPNCNRVCDNKSCDQDDGCGKPCGCLDGETCVGDKCIPDLPNCYNRCGGLCEGNSCEPGFYCLNGNCVKGQIPCDPPCKENFWCSNGTCIPLI